MMVTKIGPIFWLFFGILAKIAAQWPVSKLAISRQSGITGFTAQIFLGEMTKNGNLFWQIGSCAVHLLVTLPLVRMEPTI